jgi:hypothetical protein
LRSTEKRIACSATPTIAAQSQRLPPISALKIHRASDEHSGDNLGVVREMFEPQPLQVSHCRCASALSPKSTHPPSLIFASFSPKPSAQRFRLPHAAQSAYAIERTDDVCECFSAIGASILQLPGLLSRANEQSDSRGGLASEPTHSNRRGLRRRRCGDGKEYTSGD